MHPKLEAAYAALLEPKDDAEALRFATVRGLLYGYHERWICESWHVEAIEEEFHVPITNPDTRRPSRHFHHAGKFDGIVGRLSACDAQAGEGEIYLLEHKTTSEDLGTDSAYWKRLTIDTQISGYLLASWQLGLRLDGVLYDVVRKPEIRPRRLSVIEQRAVKFTRQYCGDHLDDEAYEAWLTLPEARETLPMYEARLRSDTLARPDWYFARRIVRRLDKELVTYASELWQTAREIHEAARAGDTRRNDRACMAYGRPCEYLDLCAGHDRPEGSRWKKLESLHPELEDTSDEDRILTYTRISTFSSCRRKHHYRYELGLTRWEEVEPLALGSLLHQALAAWWKAEAEPSGSQTPEAPRGHGPDQAPA